MKTPPDFLKMIAHDLRWQLLQALSESDLRVQELVHFVGQPQNLVSYHLRLLAEKGLVSEHRSQADRRAVYYSLDLDRLRGLYISSGQALHPALALDPGYDRQNSPVPTARVLFLCTHNSARSQIAEGLIHARSLGQVLSFSAGTDPDQVHPLAVRVASEMGLDITGQRSKSFMEYIDQEFDFIITVCDRVREVCPDFPGEPRRIHWSLIDPATAGGDEKERYTAFQDTYQQLNSRIGHFLMRLKRASEN